MCGRYTITSDAQLLADRFGIPKEEAVFSPRYNLAPTQEAPIIVETDERHLVSMRWGLIPFWAKEMSIGSKMINARAETVAEKPSFRGPLKQRRCLVAADSFYEWTAAPGTEKKVPIRFMLTEEEPFAFAGLWDCWQGTEENALYTFTIITTTANSLVSAYHKRMPAILLPENENRWLDADLTDPAELTSLLGPYPAEAMRSYQVSTLVNNVKNDSPDCIDASPSG